MKKKVLDEYLKEYCSSPTLRKRWAKLIEQRALRFYIEDRLDEGVAEEDLYFEDKKYPNLDYSEKIERDFNKWDIKNLKD